MKKNMKIGIGVAAVLVVAVGVLVSANGGLFQGAFNFREFGRGRTPAVVTAPTPTAVSPAPISPIPSSLRAGNITSDSIELYWNNAANIRINTYSIEYVDTKTGRTRVVGNTSQIPTIVSNLKAGVPYSIRVKSLAVGATDWSEYSAPLIINTPDTLFLSGYLPAFQQHVNAGTNNVLIAQFLLRPETSENVRITSVTFQRVGGSNAQDFANARVDFSSSFFGGSKSNSSGIMRFDGDLVLPELIPGVTEYALNLGGNVSPGCVSGTTISYVVPAGGITAVGATTGRPVNVVPVGTAPSSPVPSKTIICD